MQTIGVALIFVAFLSFFTVLAIGLMIVGIFIGFTWLFQYGWWATMLVILAVLVIYGAALSIGCSFIERKTA
jgi:uncharacterized protein (DUF983 family)